jgi:glutathione S-transferase
MASVPPQPTLRLHHFPGACSRVAICALEQAGLVYDIVLVDLAKGAQTSPEHLRISPLGKVPALEIDGRPLTENAAILTYVHLLRPGAGLFPVDDDPVIRAEAVGGMSFCGGTLHPQIRGLANPQRVTAGDGDPVRQRSRELLAKSLHYADARLRERGWWLGQQSIVDVYLDWAVSVAVNAGYDLTPHSALVALPERLLANAAYAHMIEGEARLRSRLN